MAKGAPPELASFLASSPSESTPLLLELARKQASRKRPADLLRQFGRDRFVEPAILDQRTMHRLDGLALEAAHEFEAVQLSPVAPLGACSVVALTSQDRTLSTTRGTEVVSDPTNVLALICATRLLAARDAEPRLCTVHQVLRAQPLPPQPGFSRHFRLLVFAEAGVGRPEDAFEVDAIARHVGVFDRLLDATAQVFPCRFPKRALTILTHPARSTLGERLRERLLAAYPHVEITEAKLEHSYYDGVRVMFGAEASSGQHIALGDTGVFDWMPRLTSNKRTRYVASGFGLQLMPILFRVEP